MKNPKEEIQPEDIFNEEKRKGVKEFIDKQIELEEAAEINSEKHHYAFGQQSEFYQLGFVEGAKWQQERMYSDEEVIDLLQEMNNWPTTFEGKIDIREWFEQFKKKTI